MAALSSLTVLSCCTSHGAATPHFGQSNAQVRKKREARPHSVYLHYQLLKRLRQKNHKFKASLDNSVRFPYQNKGLGLRGRTLAKNAQILVDFLLSQNKIKRKLVQLEIKINFSLFIYFRINRMLIHSLKRDTQYTLLNRSQRIY